MRVENVAPYTNIKVKNREKKRSLQRNHKLKLSFKSSINRTTSQKLRIKIEQE